MMKFANTVQKQSQYLYHVHVFDTHHMELRTAWKKRRIKAVRIIHESKTEHCLLKNSTELKNRKKGCLISKWTNRKRLVVCC